MNVRPQSWHVPVALGAVVLWAYWTTLGRMTERWSTDPQYSHGYLVPLFSGYLLWSRRHLLQDARLEPSWWGVGALLAGLALRTLGVVAYLGWFDEISFLFCVLGMTLAIGGLPALRWAWPAVLFLGFMAPLPFGVQTALGGYLQRVATLLSTYALQTFGAPAVAEGNTILLDDVKIGIVDACSGLGMLVTFFALSTAVAMLMRSSELWIRIVIVASAIPVAIIANVARITATGLLYNASRHELARTVFHDVAGWLMMPLAIVILIAEVRMLNRLVVNQPALDEDDAPLWLPDSAVAPAGVR